MESLIESESSACEISNGIESSRRQPNNNKFREHNRWECLEPTALERSRGFNIKAPLETVTLKADPQRSDQRVSDQLGEQSTGASHEFINRPLKLTQSHSEFMSCIERNNPASGRTKETKRLRRQRNCSKSRENNRKCRENKLLRSVLSQDSSWTSRSEEANMDSEPQQDDTPAPLDYQPTDLGSPTVTKNESMKAIRSLKGGNVLAKRQDNCTQMKGEQVGQSSEALLSRASLIIVRSNSSNQLLSGADSKHRTNLMRTTLDSKGAEGHFLQVESSRQSLSIKSAPIGDNDSQQTGNTQSKVRRTLSFASTNSIEAVGLRSPNSALANPSRKRSIATYLTQNFCSRDLSYHTDLAEDTDAGGSDSEDTNGNDGNKRDAALIPGPNKLSDLCDTTLACSKAQPTSDKMDHTAALTNEADDMISQRLRSQLQEALFGFRNPDTGLSAEISEIDGLPASGQPSSSTYSEVFETGSGVSKVRLTKRFRPLRNSGSAGGNDGERRLHLSLENLRRLVERNLVATLVGLYILVSLTVIIALILPYLFNFPTHSPRTIEPLSFATAKLIGIPSVESTEATIMAAKMLEIKQQQQVTEQQYVGGISRFSQSQQMSAQRAQQEPVRMGGAKGELSNYSTGAPKRSNAPRPVAQLVKQAKQQQPGATKSHATNNQQARVNSSDNNFHAMWNMIYRQACQPLRVPTCSRSLKSMLDGIGPASAKSAFAGTGPAIVATPIYEKTLLPNPFSQVRQTQVEKIIAKFDPVIDIKCYPLMPLFLCSIYAPKCLPLNQSQVLEELTSSKRTTGNSLETINKMHLVMAPRFPGIKLAPTGVVGDQHWSRLVPPCRSLCREALRKCTFFFEVLSLRMLNLDDCDALPESSSPDVCVGQLENNLLIKSVELQTCQDDKFRCNDGECIPRKWRCDGFADCVDKSDEEKCSKCNMESQFYCGQDVCINKEQVCNGIRDCRDGRDERQCLRLSNGTGLSENRRQLEVWSAVKNKWLPVCGAHWSAIPMSHEACQALGYSRANATTILYGPLPAAGSGHREAPGFSTHSMVNYTTAPPASNRSDPLTPNQRSPTSAWFDVAPGTTFIASGDANLGQEPIMATENEQIVGIIEDVAASQTTSGKLGRPGYYNHWVSYERPSTEPESSMDQSGLVGRELAAIDSAEVKLRSITSMLYHGPQTGCFDRANHLVSTVYLQCHNFQCGRSVTSYSSRIRLLNQAAAEMLGPFPEASTLAKNVKDVEPSSRSVIAFGETRASGKHDEEDAADGGPPRRRQCLEAEEEYGRSDYSDEAESSDDGELEGQLDFGAGVGDLLTSSSLLEQISRQNLTPAGQNSTPTESYSTRWKRFVVGGIESMPGEFPYLAALHGGPDEVFFCGGVLISINWLLTAAHCVGNRTQPDGWMVKVGVTRRMASPAFVRKLKVRKIIKHEDFNQNSLFNNDIALILLEESVEFNQYLRPICLPRANLKLGPDNSKDCVVVGFGKSKFSQEANYLHVAHFVNVPIIQHAICSNWYADHGVNLTEGMLCAGYAEGKRDACQGDSGSGLFCRYSNTNQFFVAGVVSFGIKCATPKLPGVYTSVPLYVDWIETTTRRHGYALG